MFKIIVIAVCLSGEPVPHCIPPQSEITTDLRPLEEPSDLTPFERDCVKLALMEWHIKDAVHAVRTSPKWCREALWCLLLRTW